MNYEEMNNHQINKRVARALGVEWIAVAQDGLIIDGQSASVDYCSNPSDAWPIITEHGISLVWMDAKVRYYEAHGINEDRADEDWHSQHPNALRAAMICFLKMKESENG